jgi:6-phosphogluconolactonase
VTPSALPGEVRVLNDPTAVAAAAAEWLSGLSAAAPAFHIAVSGGTTPHFLYEALASSTYRGGVDWARWNVFFADERAVPPDDAHSNYRLLHDTLLTRVPLPLAQVHRIEAERPDLDAAAADYSRLLVDQLGLPPRLHVVLLGLGENGHTASLFPGTPALEVEDAWATRGRADYEPYDRVTLTVPAINAAASVAFMVTGTSKGDALRGVVEGGVPAARVRPTDGSLHWFLDAAAARSLD